MIAANILNAKDFTFSPFTSDVGGDSGALSLATLKDDSRIQYVVKSGYPEIACNEFMYHHIAVALALYTQEARLFTGIPSNRYAVGIRYVPNAREFTLEQANEDDKRIYYEFRTLFVILNEEDSEEFFYDEEDRVFKLDNAASFNLGTLIVENAIKYGKKELPNQIWQILMNGLNYTEYEKYGILLHAYNEYFGRKAVEAGYDFIRRFSEFDLSWIKTACETLEKVYPLTITEYYPAFIERRKDACKRFITENKVSEFIGE